MNIFFRVDASITIGIGHVMRCLSLAKSISAKGMKVSFICRELPGHLCDFVERRGFTVFRLPLEDSPESDWSADVEKSIFILKSQRHEVDWLIVDHYGLGLDWEKSLRPYIKQIMVIDDLAREPHECDLILNQNFIHNLETRYDHLVPSDAEKLVGPTYALLRPEFREAREHLRSRVGKLEHIFVFLGICKEAEQTLNILEGIRLFHRLPMTVDVVVEERDPHKEAIKKFCQTLSYSRFHCQVNNMAELMVFSDFAIGTGGSTTWERCCLGLPALVMALEENQRELTEAVASQGAIIQLKTKETPSPATYLNILNQLTPAQLRTMSEKGMALVDGYGCRWVVEKLYEKAMVK